jgi:23S rRNA pseudouridine1911/1915/1917 synthase
MTALDVVWTGPDLLGVVKPPGLSCFPPHADPSGDCVLRRLLHAFPEQADPTWPLGFDGGIAHRLDISTSGLLLIARSVDALAALRTRFSSRRLRKEYRFLTQKQVDWDQNTVDRPIAHDRRRKGRVVVQRGRNTPHRGRWRDAETHFRRLGPVDGGLWLWQAEMSTGVMHQIRVHAAFVGLALVGDRLYGGGAWDLPRPRGVSFALHHHHLEGPDLHPTAVEVPGWWPAVLSTPPTEPNPDSPVPFRRLRRER